MTSGGTRLTQCQARHVARLGEGITTHTFLAGKPENKGTTLETLF
jgi:hypothetical protein